MKKQGMRAALTKKNQATLNSKPSAKTPEIDSPLVGDSVAPLSKEMQANPLGTIARMPTANARQNVFRSLAGNNGNNYASQLARSLGVQRAPTTKKQPLSLEQQMSLLHDWYGSYIKEASEQYGVGVDELSGIIATEVRGELSKGSKEGMATASSGAAFGIMQLTRGTWEDVQKNHKELSKYDFDNWTNPHINILFGAAALADKKKALQSKTMLGKDAKVTDEMAFVAYNAGQGTVKIAYQLARAGGSKQPEVDYLSPQYLKKAIEQTGIYSYYKKRNSKLSDAEAIDLKFKEITAYPDLAKARIKAMKGAGAKAVTAVGNATTGTTAPATTTPKTEDKLPLTPAEEQTVLAALQKAVADGKKAVAATDAGYFAIRPDHQIKASDSKAVGEWKYIYNTLLPKVKSTKAAETPAHSTATTAPAKTTPAPQQHETAQPTKAGDPDALDSLLGLPHNTPHYTAEQIKKARDLIVQEKNATKRGELFMLLQGKVEYHNQRNNASTGGTQLDADNNRTGKKIGDVMCNLTSLAMALETLGISNPEPDKYPQYEDYLEHVGRDKYKKNFDRTSQWQQVASAMGANVDIIGSGYLKQKWWQDKALPKLQEGNGMMMSITGHIVRLQDVKEKGLIIDDPYGTVDLKAGTKWGYKGSRNAADSENGKGVIGENNLWTWDKVEAHSMKWVGVISKKAAKK